MKFAVISDVHSNLEALERTLSYVRALGVDQIVCLGDVVGYGANPSECLKMIKEEKVETILGNHDQAICDLSLRDYFNAPALKALEWTARVVTEEDKKQLRSFSSPQVDRANQVTWTHSSVHEPEEYHYIYTASDAKPSFEKLETNICFFGHTHIPSLFSAREGTSHYLPAGSYQLEKGAKYLINPGSVGQPRDRNPRLSFALFDSESLELKMVRLPYDHPAAARKIRAAGLPEVFAARLFGLSTGQEE